MANGVPTTDSSLVDLLHHLAAFEPRGDEVISLYLDVRPGPSGRDACETFLRRAFAGPLVADVANGAADAESRLERILGRIRAHLADVDPSIQGAAIFTAVGDETFFAAAPLDGLDGHQLFIGAVPHLYPLVRAIGQSPRYAAVLVDNHRARIVVFGLGTQTTRTEVQGEKTRRHSMGGWSQARYQRRIQNLHLHHLKEVVDTLDRVVRDESIERIVLAGTAEVVARFRSQLPDHLAALVVDELRIDRHAGEARIIDEALDVFRRGDASDDAGRLAEVVDAWRSGGLGTVGPDATLRALQLGQVDELLVTAAPDTLKTVQRLPDDAAPAPVLVDAASRRDPAQWALADELVTRATQTGATVRIIEDPELLRPHGGVAAALRFRI